MASLQENITQAVSDFANIKQAIIDKGVPINAGTKTSQYADLIKSISGGDSSSPYVAEDLIYNVDCSNWRMGDTGIIQFPAFENLSNNATFEVCFTYSDFTNTDKKGRIFELGYGTNHASLYYSASLNSTYAEFYIYQYNSSAWELLEEDSGISVNANEIHTISCTIENNISLYFDGALITQFVPKTTMPSSATPTFLSINTSGNRTDRDMNGLVYNFRLYNRALTEEEIATNIASDKTNYGGE